MKALIYTDLRVLPNQLFWHRDLGLLTKAFRTLGHDAWLVVHPATEPNTTPVVPNKLDLPREQPCVAQQGLPRLSVAGPHSPLPTRHPPPVTLQDPVLWASPSDVRSPSWWQSQTPDLVILGLWTRPKYDPIRRAALSATPRVIERADSDGMRTASCGLRTYARRRYDYFRDRTYRWPALLSIPASFLYSLASILATPWIEARLARTLKLLPALTVETTQATQLWKKLAVKLGANPKRIHCIPHPIQTDIFCLDPSVRKKNQVISVGRWDSYQKNLPRLLKTLRSFLEHNPCWTALVVGSGLPAASSHPRITFSAPLPPRKLAHQMRRSKLFLSASRFESFGLALAESLCCGCIPWGPSDLGPIYDFRTLVGLGKGRIGLLPTTLAPRIFPEDFLFLKTAKKALFFFAPKNIAKRFLDLSKALDGKGSGIHAHESS